MHVLQQGSKTLGSIWVLLKSMRLRVTYPSFWPFPGCESHRERCEEQTCRLEEDRCSMLVATTADVCHTTVTLYIIATCSRIMAFPCSSHRLATPTWSLCRAWALCFTLRKFTGGSKRNKHSSAVKFYFCQVHGCLSHSRPPLVSVILQPGDPSFHAPS